MRAIRFPALLASLVLLARFAPVFFASAFLASAFFVSALAAEKYPSRPVHWIVGFAAGGPNDIVARIMGEWLSAHLGQQFVIETASAPAA
jgi:tripartite-type tricarboxylate transporter receptor subunit TctC